MQAISLTTAILLAASIGAAPAADPAARDATALEDAAGTAVVAALRTQFDGRQVEFRLQEVEADPVSLRDMALAGDGAIRIEDAGGWLPIRFEALYDRATGQVLNPTVSLARNPGAPATTPTQGLDAAVDAALAKEFAYQDVAFALGDAWRTGGNERYAVVDGEGVATFAGEGAATVDVQGVYDLADGRWIRVDYALGGTPEPRKAMVASR